MKSKELKVRASQTGAIMTSPRTKTNAQKFQEAEEAITKKTERLNGLSDKAQKTREKLQEDIANLRLVLDELRPIKDIVELSATTKQAVISMFWQNEYGIERDINTKQMDKGNQEENTSIELAQRVNAWDPFVTKNEEHYENDFLTGTPDLVYDWGVVDIKTSWTAHSFPLVETEVPNASYYYQLQAYMALTGKTEAVLTYCLVDTPEILIQDELYKYARTYGLMETPGDVELRIRLSHTYSRLPDALRVRNFHIERNEKVINDMYDRIQDCRKFYNELLQLKNEK